MSELQRLRDRVDELEELLGLKEKVEVTIPAAAHSPRRVKMVLRLLAARELVSRAAINLAIGHEGVSDRSAAVYVCYARKSLLPHGIKVHNDWNRGWYVAAADKPKLKALLRGEVSA